MPEKAYNNVTFLHSPDARALRILAEFLEPLARFRKHRIRDTIVLFGSARVRPLKITKAEFDRLQRKLKRTTRRTKQLLQHYEAARVAKQMSRYYEDAVRLTRMLTRWSRSLNSEQRFVICSGGGPGIMEAANKGAAMAGGKSIGLNISIPFEQGSNSYITPELNFQFHYFFMRKFWFVYLAKAMVIFPGGFGTMDELMEVLTLLQTHKVTKKLALVIYGSAYWKEVLNFDAMVKYQTISPNDLKLFKFADSPEEAFEYLKGELAKNYLES